MADSLRECAEHGQKFVVVAALQNHGDFINTGEEHLRLLQRVDHEWCAALEIRCARAAPQQLFSAFDQRLVSAIFH